MKRGNIIWLQVFVLLGAFVTLPSCSSSSSISTGSDRSPAASGYGATAYAGSGYAPVPSTPGKSPTSLYREVNVKKDYIPRGKHARKYRRSMKPRYITIHSTQNYSSSADALRHSQALKSGKLRARKRRGGNRIGYLVWHFSVDEDRAVQHLPTDEQGEHADFDGPGNRYSIGVEMCENRGNSRSATIERTAKLAAYLMHKHDIPLRKVVPHYHWPRRGLSQPHKNCPHYLLDNGRPGAKWQWFLAKVDKHYKSITTGSPGVVPQPGVLPTPPTPPIQSTPPPRPYPSSPIISEYGAIAAAAPVKRPVPAAAPVPVTSAVPVTSVSTYQPRPVPVTTVSRPASVSKKPTPRPSTRYHTVVKGDTLYSLSRRYGTSVAAIQRANGLQSHSIYVGRKLRIPAS